MQAMVRPPAWAGQFYPGNADLLRDTITDLLAATVTPPGAPPKAIIAPHAGYIYSGPVAAAAYAALLPVQQRIHRVILLGPSHRVALAGMAICSADYYATPLGMVPVDHAATMRIATLPGVELSDHAHAEEHSLEVHLPFLQTVLGHFTLVPIVVGDSTPEEVAAVLETFWDEEDTLIVVSSDLSHYHDYATARTCDQRTSTAITHRRYGEIGPLDACGCRPMNGLLYLATKHGLTVEMLDLRNSGDTAGPRDRVVGYGAYSLH